MNKNVLIVLAGGFLIALLVAIIVQASFGSKKDGTMEVLVAATASGRLSRDRQQFQMAGLSPGLRVRRRHRARQGPENR